MTPAGRRAIRFGNERRESGMQRGAWADLAFVAFGKAAKIAREKVATRAGFRPYVDFEFAARVRATMINGQTAWSDGRVRGEAHGTEVFE